MASVEFNIGNQKYVLRGDESEEHLKEVAELVKRKVDGLRKKTAGLTIQKAAILAAFDFASQSIKGRRKSSEFRSHVLSRASQLLDKVERELN